MGVKEHLETIKVIFEIVFLLISIFLASSYLIELYKWDIIVISAFGLVVYVIERQKKRRDTLPAVTIPEKPNRILKSYNVKTFEVDWDAFWGTASIVGDSYVYIEGPYCPTCKYELDIVIKGLRRKYHWKCVPCNRLFACPEEGPYSASGIVRKYVESEIRSGRTFNTSPSATYWRKSLLG